MKIAHATGKKYRHATKMNERGLSFRSIFFLCRRSFARAL